MNIKSPVIAQSNKLTESRYNFSVIEKRALYFIIREVRRQFIERPDGQRDLFENLIVQMNTEKLQASDTALREIYIGMRSLRKKEIIIEDEDKILNVGYINYFKHDKKDDHVEVEVSKEILPYLVELASNYTEYHLLIALTLKNRYSQRFYELCCQWKNTGFFVMTVEKLRTRFMLENKYPRYALLKSKVIDAAKKELDKLYDEGQCDVSFDYTIEKVGRRVDRFKFTIKNKENESSTQLGLDDYVYYIRTWLKAWLNADNKPKNLKWVGLVLDTLNKNPDNLKICYEKLVWMQRNKDSKDWAPYARHIITEDFLS